MCGSWRDRRGAQPHRRQHPRPTLKLHRYMILNSSRLNYKRRSPVSIVCFVFLFSHCILLTLLSCTAVRISGFGLFFAIFDLSRRAAIHTSHAVESVVSGQTWTVRSILDSFDDYEHANKDDRNRAPTSARVAQGTVLVGGGGESSTSI